MNKIMSLLITLNVLEKHIRIFKDNCIFTEKEQETITKLIEYINDEITDVLKEEYLEK